MKILFFVLLVAASFSVSAQLSKRRPTKSGNEAERLTALNLIKLADTMKQSAHWPGISPADFLANLKRNIEQPFKMNNGRNTNFCAYGAISYTCLKNEPARYVQSMLELYRNGSALYRNIWLTPSDAIKRYAGTMMFQGDLDIYPADQIWFLSLADRFKGYLNFFNKRFRPGDENTMWAASNLAKFNRMLRKLCKYKVSSRGSDIVRPRSKNLALFIKEKLEGGELYLYLNNSILRKKNHNRMRKKIPTHFVVLMEIKQDDDGYVMLKYWDGGYKTLKHISESSLKKIIYGITWVRYNEKNNE